jgi:hypothetical protein
MTERLLGAIPVNLLIGKDIHLAASSETNRAVYPTLWNFAPIVDPRKSPIKWLLSEIYWLFTSEWEILKQLSTDRVHVLPVTEKDLTGDERWGLVTRVAASQRFARAAQLRELLLYFGRRAILQPGAEVSEQEIGCQVLGRRPDYDTQADNIVRVQIRHLRQKLDEYFDSEGREEPLLLTIPKGTRVARFEPRLDWTTVPAEPSTIEHPVSAALPERREARTVSIFRLLAGAAVVIAVALGAFLLGRYLSASPGSTAALGSPGTTPLFQRLFPAGGTATVVLADSSLVFIQDVLRVHLGLDEVTKGAHRKLIEGVQEERLRSALTDLSSRQYTSLADATLSGKLLRIGLESGSHVAVRYSRHMGIRDFSSGNFILLGSKRGIPWVDLFEPDLSFRLERTGPGWRFGFTNRQPQGDELAAYTTTDVGEGSYETYATISLVPNVGRNGDVLLLDGTMMEATEAAGEFAMSSAFSRVLAEKFGGTSAQKIPYFEVLLNIRARSGAPNKVEVAAWRKRNTE